MHPKTLTWTLNTIFGDLMRNNGLSDPRHNILCMLKPSSSSNLQKMITLPDQTWLQESIKNNKFYLNSVV